MGSRMVLRTLSCIEESLLGFQLWGGSCRASRPVLATLKFLTVLNKGSQGSILPQALQIPRPVPLGAPGQLPAPREGCGDFVMLDTCAGCPAPPVAPRKRRGCWRGDPPAPGRRNSTFHGTWEPVPRGLLLSLSLGGARGCGGEGGGCTSRASLTLRTALSRGHSVVRSQAPLWTVVAASLSQFC